MPPAAAPGLTPRLPGSSAGSLQRLSLRRLVVPLLGAAALALVLSMVPLRERCAAPAVVGATPMALIVLERFTGGGCALSPLVDRAGPGSWDLMPSCASLRCEPGFLSVLARARGGALLLLALATLAATALSTLRWYSLLGLARFRGSFLWAWRACLAAQAGGLVLPGGVGGDAVRFTLTLGARQRSTNSTETETGTGAGHDRGEPDVPVATLAATVLLDRMLGLVSLTTLGGLLAAVFGDRETTRTLYVLVALPPLFFVGLAVVRSDLVYGLGIFRHRLGAALRPVLDYLRSPGSLRAIFRGLVASLLFSGVQLGVIRGIVYALGAPLVAGGAGAEKWIFLGGAMGLLVAGLPGLPGGWGTADLTYVHFLQNAGLPPSTGLAVCLLNRIFYYGVAAVGASVLLASGMRGSLLPAPATPPIPPTDPNDGPS